MNRMQWYEAAQKFNRMCETCGPNCRPALQRYMILLMKSCPLEFFDGLKLIFASAYEKKLNIGELNSMAPKGSFMIPGGVKVTAWRPIP